MQLRHDPLTGYRLAGHNSVIVLTKARDRKNPVRCNITVTIRDLANHEKREKRFHELTTENPSQVRTATWAWGTSDCLSRVFTVSLSSQFPVRSCTAAGDPRCQGRRLPFPCQFS